jgi:hypothetical protein
MKFAWIAGVLLLTGCAHTITFKVVDAASGRPVSGVAANWRQDSADLLLGTYHFGPTNLPPSGEDGVVVVRGIYRGKQNRFIFSKSEYATVYGIYSMGRRFSESNQTNSIAGWDGFILEEPLTGITPTNGVIVIRMKEH